ncbi:MAG TPA: FAD-dependent oxidoreductase, partial [Lacipirellula sp.]
DYVVTENDTRRKRQPEDPVGMGSYNMDSHNCQRYVDENGHAANEGDVQVSPGGPYAISYRAIVPKRGEAENLLVPVCLSSSHIAYGSIRMEPVFMILGQSAATAACQAIDAGIAVQDVDYGPLKERLLADKQILQYSK